MFHPFKKAESVWNAHTPVFLHNRTKENFIFQLAGCVLMLFGFLAKDAWDERQLKKRREARNIEVHIAK